MIVLCVDHKKKTIKKEESKRIPLFCFYNQVIDIYSLF